MIFLIGSILCSTFLTVAFKLCDRFQVNKFQAIIFNYLTCFITGSIINGGFPNLYSTVGETWFPWAIFMGICFVLSFNLIALTVQKSGLAIASVASKLSLVIPFIASIVLYSEDASGFKIMGIVLALLAVVLTIYSPAGTTNRASTGRASPGFVLPLIVFLFTGLLDTMVKYVEQRFLTGSNNNEYLVVAFIAAFAGGAAYFVYALLTRKMRFDPKAILAGILIGVPNYFSIWFLVKVLKLYPRESAVLLPVNNLGIVLCSALLAWGLFKEHLKQINWFGIMLAIIAICLIAFG